MAENLEKLLTLKSKVVRVIYISSYIPRKCGIATYTKDLTNAINLLNPQSFAKIAAMNNGDSSRIKYPHEVVFIVKQEDWLMYKKLAAFINKSSDIEIVSLQHEFCIYGGEMGAFVCDFIDLVKKPIVATLHTVKPNPDKKQKRIINKICDKSKYVVVMIKAASDILEKAYKVDRSKIIVIHHGVPDFPISDTNYWKRKLRLKDRVVMSNINLLGEGKGVEYALQSIPKIAEKIPNFIYLIIGETHPVYLKYQKKIFGKDKYREKLLNIVRDLNIKKNVRFINRYISLEQLIEYIGASDYYITPYLDPQQAASGSLAYAIGAGKLCISTPYLYAKELLSKGRGILVPFRDSEAISEAVIKMHKNSALKRKTELNAYKVGRKMIWVNVGHLYFHLFQQVLNKN